MGSLREALEAEGQIASDDELLTVPEAAAYFKVTNQTIYNWIHIGKIDTVKLGPGPKSPVRIPRAELRRITKENFRPRIKKELADG